MERVQLPKSMRDIRRELAKNRGLKHAWWEWARTHAHELSTQATPKDRAAVAWAAFIAGQYEVAREFGIADPLFRGQTALYLSDEKMLGSVLEPTSENHRIIKMALEMMKRRMSGDFARGIEIFENEIAPLLCECTDELRAHIELMAGSPYFNASRYSAARDCYARAYAFFSQAKQHAFAAISAYNTAVTSEYLGLKIESATLEEKCEGHLKKYEVPGLRQTLALKKIQGLVAAKEHQKAIHLASEYLKQKDLSRLQRVLGLIAACQARLEIGQVTRARMHLTEAQEIVIGQKLTQFAPFLAALESEVANWTYTASLATQTHNTQDLRAQLLKKVVRCRSLALQGQKKLAIGLFTEIKNEFAQSLLRRVDHSDLEITVNESMPDFRNLTARAAWALCLYLVERADLGLIRAFLQDSTTGSQEPAREPLREISQFVAQGFLRLQIERKGVGEFLQALDCARREGLDRVANLIAGILAFCDSHFEMDWIRCLESLPPHERETLRASLRRLIGHDVGDVNWILHDNGQRMMGRMREDHDEVDLVIDEPAGTITLKKCKLPIAGHSVVFRLLTELVRSGHNGLSKEDIVRRVWATSYDPSRHDTVIYSNIKRLRKWIEITLSGSGHYRIPRDIRWRLVTRHSPGLTEREESILSLIANSRELQRLDVVRNLGLSARTALRLLNDLVEKKYLIRSGKGRGVVYVAATA